MHSSPIVFRHLSILLSVLLLSGPIAHAISYDDSTRRGLASSDESISHETCNAPRGYTKIHNAEQFDRRIRANLDGKYFLCNDIDLNDLSPDDPYGHYFTPFGSMDEPFTGRLDGNGKQISNLTIFVPSEDYPPARGLFAKVVSGSVRNLTIHNASVSGLSEIGVIAGHISNAAITDISLTGALFVGAEYTPPPTVTIAAGGIVGFARNSQIRNVTIQSDSVMTIYGRNAVGGVVGWMQESTEIIDCSLNDVDISGEIWIGGVAGIAQDSSIGRTGFFGGIQGNGAQIGGIAGLYRVTDLQNQEHSIYETRAIGSMYQGFSNNVGGLVGLLGDEDGNQLESIRDCYSDLEFHVPFNSTPNADVGGLVGTALSGTITRSLNVGDSDGAAGSIGIAADGVVVNDSFFLVPENIESPIDQYNVGISWTQLSNLSQFWTDNISDYEDDLESTWEYVGGLPRLHWETGLWED